MEGMAEKGGEGRFRSVILRSGAAVALYFPLLTLHRSLRPSVVRFYRRPLELSARREIHIEVTHIRHLDGTGFLFALAFFLSFSSFFFLLCRRRRLLFLLLFLFFVSSVLQCRYPGEVSLIGIGSLSQSSPAQPRPAVF